MINCSKALHLVPLVLLVGCLRAQALFSAVLVVWVSFVFLTKVFLSLLSRWTWLFFRCQVILALDGDQNYNPGGSQQNRILIQMNFGISKCQTGEEKLMGHWSTLPSLDFLFFLWKELITATKRVKKRRKMGWEERRENIKTKHQVLWIMYNALDSKEPGHRVVIYESAPIPTAFEEGKANKGWKLFLTCYWQIFIWKIYPKLAPNQFL